jgi:hypothetical protein
MGDAASTPESHALSGRTPHEPPEVTAGPRHVPSLASPTPLSSSAAVRKRCSDAGGRGSVTPSAGFAAIR